MKQAVVAGVMLLGLAASARAEETRFPLPDALFAGIVQERDVALIFGYAREAFSAAIEGRDAPPPDELSQRAEVIGGELKRRGATAGRAIIDLIESKVRGAMREPRGHQPLPIDPGRRI